MEVELTKKQAYLAMFAFLDDYYQRSNSDEVAIMLGGMSLLSDGSVADSAIEDDWNKAVKKVLGGKVDATLEFSKIIKK